MKPRFNYTKMRQEFYAWHGGQDSPIYAAASSGLVSDVGALQRELIGNAEWCEANPGVQPDTAKDARYLRRVANALPEILSEPVTVTIDGRDRGVYRCLPWAGQS